MSSATHGSSLGASPITQFDLMVFDAFSSDAIPLHLATREALTLYVAKLAPGASAFQIRTAYSELAPVLGTLAQDSGLVAVFGQDTDVGGHETAEGRVEAEWVLMARRLEDFGPLLTIAGGGGSKALATRAFGPTITPTSSRRSSCGGDEAGERRDAWQLTNGECQTRTFSIPGPDKVA